MHIPKPGKAGKTRPLGIPTLEDKVLQRAVLMALEPIFEQDFLDCSYGFRPARGPHMALEALWRGLMSMGGGWVVDLDIRSFFDEVDRDHLRDFLGRRVRDRTIRRAVGKWLNAGVMEDGAVRRSERGTPQGGVISPLLSNLYLHHVLDEWFERDAKPRLRGRAFMVRFADDAVLAFEREEDARRVYAVLGERFAKYGLRLHPDKTRLVDFRSPPRRTPGGTQRERSFALLGFTHHWGRSRKRRWTVKRKTAQDRLARAMRAVGDWCREPPPAGGGAVGGAAAEAAGPLRLLRHHRQLPCAGAVPLVGPRDVVQVAVSPRAARADDLGPLPASVPPLSATPTASRAERLSCSYTVARGAGCANRARPDLWEPGAGDRPRPPGPSVTDAAGTFRAGDRGP